MDDTKRQWADLGTLTEACIVRPETCGAEGGALAMWIRRKPSNGANQGVFSSAASNGTSGTTGLHVTYFPENL